MIVVILVNPVSRQINHYETKKNTLYVKHFLSTPVMYECVFKAIALKKVKLYKSAE